MCDKLNYGFCVFFVINKTKTYQTTLPQQDTAVLTILLFLPAYAPFFFFDFFLEQNLLTILFLPSTLFQSLKLSCVWFLLSDILVNVKQQGFWKTIPWFQVFSAFRSITLDPHQGWFPDMKTDFKLSSMVFGRDVLKGLPWGFRGFVFVCLSRW